MSSELLRRPAGRTKWLAAGLGAIALLGLLAGGIFLTAEFRREVALVAARLDDSADAKARLVQGWFESRAALARSIAGNTTVQLHLSGLMAGDENAEATQAEAAYVVHYLSAALEAVGPTGSDRSRAGGAAVRWGYLLDAEGRPVASSAGAPDFDPRWALQPGASIGEAGTEPVVTFVEPVRALPGMGDDVVGRVVVVQDMSAGLFQILQTPPPAERSAEYVLLARDGEFVRYLSPSLDGTAIGTRRAFAGGETLAEVRAVARPGEGARAPNAAGEDMFFASRAIEGTPWTLLHQVRAGEVMVESRGRVARLGWALGSAWLVVVLGAVAIWRHATSRRAEAASASLRETTERLQAQERLFRTVLDFQPHRVALLDGEHRIVFVNRVGADISGLMADDVVGRHLSALWPADVARRLMERARRAIESKVTVEAVDQENEDGRISAIRYLVVPVAGEGAGTGQVLVFEENISELVNARARGERMLRRVIEALVDLVDRRDPHAGHHSRRVAALARAVVEQMRMSAALAETAEIAGQLMNLGKIVIPRELLQKPGGLSESELAAIRECSLTSADILSGIDFQGPVVEILRRMVEEPQDGDDASDEVVLASRILSVVNRYVAMTSARSYRPAVPTEQALDILMKQASGMLERRVVAALVGALDMVGTAPAPATEAVPA